MNAEFLAGSWAVFLYLLMMTSSMVVGSLGCGLGFLTLLLVAYRLSL